MPRRNNSKGSILIAALFFTCLILALCLSLSRIAEREISSSISRLQGIRAQTLAQNDLSQLLGLLEASAATNAALESLTAVELNTSSAPSSKYQLSIQRSAGSALSRGGVLISLNTHPIYGFPQPNWSALVESSSLSAAHCRRWTQSALAHASPSSTLTSSRTCFALPTLNDSSIFLHGNLHLDSSVIYSNVHKKTLLLAVTGSLKASEINLMSCSDTSVEIIAGGNIQIDRLRMQASQNISTLIHSSTGSITIKESPDSFQLETCGKPNHSLSLEAAGEIRIADSVLSPPHSLGCSVARQATFWPKYKIIGELLG